MQRRTASGLGCRNILHGEGGPEGKTEVRSPDGSQGKDWCK